MERAVRPPGATREQPLPLTAKGPGRLGISVENEQGDGLSNRTGTHKFRVTVRAKHPVSVLARDRIAPEESRQVKATGVDRGMRRHSVFPVLALECEERRPEPFV